MVKIVYIILLVFYSKKRPNNTKNNLQNLKRLKLLVEFKQVGTGAKGISELSGGPHA